MAIRPARRRSPRAHMLRSPPRTAALRRHLVGSAHPSSRRAVTVRAASRRSDREGRRHVRDRGVEAAVRTVARRTVGDHRGGRGPPCASRRRPRRPRPPPSKGSMWRSRRRRGSGSSRFPARPVVRGDRVSARWFMRSSRPCRSTRPPPSCRAQRRHTAACWGRRATKSLRRQRLWPPCLNHDLMRRAADAERVRRETPVSWVQEDGTLIEGVLDLAFDEGDLTTVVDFKTDQELAAGESRYRAQVHQYASAVSRATGRRAAGILFRI